MGQVIKRGGKRQQFMPVKVRRSIKKAAEEARVPPAKVRELVKEVGEAVIDFYKKKRVVKSADLRRSILGRLERRVKRAAAAWRRYEKKKKKK